MIKYRFKELISSSSRIADEITETLLDILRKYSQGIIVDIQTTILPPSTVTITGVISEEIEGDTLFEFVSKSVVTVLSKYGMESLVDDIYLTQDILYKEDIDTTKDIVIEGNAVWTENSSLTNYLPVDTCLINDIVEVLETDTFIGGKVSLVYEEDTQLPKKVKIIFNTFSNLTPDIDVDSERQRLASNILQPILQSRGFTHKVDEEGNILHTDSRGNPTKESFLPWMFERKALDIVHKNKEILSFDEIGRTNTLNESYTYGTDSEIKVTNFVGKSIHFVERKGLYLARFIAKNIVHFTSGYFNEVTVKLVYEKGSDIPTEIILLSEVTEESLKTDLIERIKEDIDFSTEGVTKLFNEEYIEYSEMLSSQFNASNNVERLGSDLFE